MGTLILGLNEVTEAVETAANPVDPVGLEVSPDIEGTYVGHSRLGQVLFTAEELEDNGDVVLDDDDVEDSVVVSGVLGGGDGGGGGVVVLGFVQHSVLTASE